MVQYVYWTAKCNASKDEISLLLEPGSATEKDSEHEALLAEMRRSTFRSPSRLRIAMGLVAAERSPKAYTVRAHPDERWEFEREFTWFMRLMILFGLFHVVIFVILLAVPR